MRTIYEYNGEFSKYSPKVLLRIFQLSIRLPLWLLSVWLHIFNDSIIIYVYLYFLVTTNAIMPALWKLVPIHNSICIIYARIGIQMKRLHKNSFFCRLRAAILLWYFYYILCWIVSVIILVFGSVQFLELLLFYFCYVSVISPFLLFPTEEHYFSQKLRIFENMIEKISVK